jgi:hypothetical protein
MLMEREQVSSVVAMRSMSRALPNGFERIHLVPSVSALQRDVRDSSSSRFFFILKKLIYFLYLTPKNSIGYAKHHRCWYLKFLS